MFCESDFQELLDLAAKHQALVNTKSRTTEWQLAYSRTAERIRELLRRVGRKSEWIQPKVLKAAGRRRQGSAHTPIAPAQGVTCRKRTCSAPLKTRQSGPRFFAQL